MSEKFLKPGEARCPGVSVQDLLDQDSRPVPVYLREQSYEFLGDEDIPYERYTSKDYFDKEVEHVWPRTWQWTCREEHIPESGDYMFMTWGLIRSLSCGPRTVRSTPIVIPVCTAVPN